MHILNLLIVFGLSGTVVACIGFLFCLYKKKSRRRRILNEQGRHALERVIELGKEDSRGFNKASILALPATLNVEAEEQFFFRLFSTERPKTIASKGKDTVDPALESYDFPKEFHSSAVFRETDQNIIVFCYGGQDKENPQRNYHQPIMFLRFSIDETKTIFQEQTILASSFEPHTTNQAKNYVKGCSFQTVSMGAAEFCNNDIWMFGGFDLRYDQTTNELYCFQNVKFVKNNSEVELSCQHYPGPTTLQKSGITGDQLHGLKYQRGTVPKERMGHTLTKIEDHLILIGGHQKIWQKGRFRYYNMEENLFMMDTKTQTWNKIVTIEGEKESLKRSLFMSVVYRGDIYVAGGSVYTEKEVRRLDIFKVLKLKISLRHKSVSIETIFINSTPVCLSSATMAQRNGFFYVCGGVEEKSIDEEVIITKSGNFYVIDIEEKQMSKKTVGEEMKDLLKVYGSSSFWFGQHSMIVVSGTRPELGKGFRNMLCYTQLENREMLCDAATCLIFQKTGRVPWIQCDKCNKWVHDFCDEKVRNRKTERNGLCMQKYRCI